MALFGRRFMCREHYHVEVDHLRGLFLIASSAFRELIWEAGRHLLVVEREFESLAYESKLAKTRLHRANLYDPAERIVAADQAEEAGLDAELIAFLKRPPVRPYYYLLANGVAGNRRAWEVGNPTRIVVARMPNNLHRSVSFQPIDPTERVPYRHEELQLEPADVRQKYRERYFPPGCVDCPQRTYLEE